MFPLYSKAELVWMPSKIVAIPSLALYLYNASDSDIQNVPCPSMYTWLIKRYLPDNFAKSACNSKQSKSVLY